MYIISITHLSQRQGFQHPPVIHPDETIIGSHGNVIWFGRVHSYALHLAEIVTQIDEDFGLRLPGAFMGLPQIVLSKKKCHSEFDLSKNNIYMTSPSSAADQNSVGSIGDVAKRLTRLTWQLHSSRGGHFAMAPGIDWTRTLQSPAAVAISLLPKNCRKTIQQFRLNAKTWESLK